jgi:broad specificity phosphatase PhoE
MRVGRFPDDDPLDARGLAEVAATCRQWAGTPDSMVLCSPARCAQQTATALGLCASVDVALRDADYGSWRGKSLRDLARDMPAALGTWMNDPSASPHGGDSFEDVLRRVGTWLDHLKLHESIVAITHSAVVRAAIVHALGAGPRAMSRIEVAPLSFAELKLSSAGWKLMASSSTSLCAI